MAHTYRLYNFMGVPLGGRGGQEGRNSGEKGMESDCEMKNGKQDSKNDWCKVAEAGKR